MRRPAVFLDRDGVINRDRLDFIKSWEEFEFLPSSLEALAALAKTTYQVIVVSNQSGIARGLLSESVLEEIHQKMIERIRGTGGRVDAVYYCPHHPNAGCDCRKPAPGLFLTAARDLDIDLASSWSIGDRFRDVEAANRAGVSAILLTRDLPDVAEVPEARLQFVRAANLLDAIGFILGAAENSK